VQHRLPHCVLQGTTVMDLRTTLSYVHQGPSASGRGCLVQMLVLQAWSVQEQMPLPPPFPLGST